MFVVKYIVAHFQKASKLDENDSNNKHHHDSHGVDIKIVCGHGIQKQCYTSVESGAPKRNEFHLGHAALHSIAHRSAGRPGEHLGGNDCSDEDHPLGKVDEVRSEVFFVIAHRLKSLEVMLLKSSGDIRHGQCRVNFSSVFCGYCKSFIIRGWGEEDGAGRDPRIKVPQDVVPTLASDAKVLVRGILRAPVCCVVRAEGVRGVLTVWRVFSISFV